MSSHDVLHRLADHLDEIDAEILASFAAAAGVHDAGKQNDSFIAQAATPDSNTTTDLTILDQLGRPSVVEVKTLARAAQTGRWSEEAKGLLRKWLNRTGEGPERRTLLALVLVADPPSPLREEVASALLSGQGPGHGAASRRRKLADTLGSIRAEGIEPSPEFLDDAAEYEAGRITSEELYRATLRRARAIAEQ